jgi:anti-sigma regulatory factor (Ser/Thr protein kinase)
MLMAEGSTELLFNIRVEAAAPFIARQKLREADVLADGMRPDLELLVTELVTNVVRHSGLGSEDSMDVSVRIERQHVWVQVRDSGRGMGRTPFDPGDRSIDATGGYGLFLLDRIASRWGMVDRPGTTVWFELTE